MSIVTWPISWHHKTVLVSSCYQCMTLRKGRTLSTCHSQNPSPSPATCGVLFQIRQRAVRIAIQLEFMIQGRKEMMAGRRGGSDKATFGRCGYLGPSQWEDRQSQPRFSESINVVP